jgi:hypothetical protein
VGLTIFGGAAVQKISAMHFDKKPTALVGFRRLLFSLFPKLASKKCTMWCGNLQTALHIEASI